MCDAEILRNCDVVDCFAVAVGRGRDGRQLCDPHFYAHDVNFSRRMWRGRSWRDTDPVPVQLVALIGVLRALRPAADYPPGHYYAECDVCDRSCVIGPGEYPYPVCDKCDERYERRCRGEV